MQANIPHKYGHKDEKQKAKHTHAGNKTSNRGANNSSIEVKEGI